MADKTKQYENLKKDIEWIINLYKDDLEEVEEFINFKENLTVNDDDSTILKIAKYFILYESESEIIKRLKNTPIFLDDDGNYIETTKEGIKNLIEYMSTDGFIFSFSFKKKNAVYMDSPITPSNFLFEYEETEEEIKLKKKLERERNEKLDKINKEIEEFQTIGKMIKFILDCQKRKSSPRARKIPLKNYGAK